MAPVPPSPSPRTDYGWRLHGHTVTVLRDRSFDLKGAFQPIGSFLSRHCSDVHTLQSCLQCGACTASCNLSSKAPKTSSDIVTLFPRRGAGSAPAKSSDIVTLFPRREMTLVQMGLQERLMADPAIWYCYNCDDCSEQCPSKARPGSVMAALRHLAVERFAAPGFLARLANRPLGLTALVGISAALVALPILAFGSFAPEGPVVFGHMFPHFALDTFFFGFSALAAVSMVVGLDRAWRAWQGESLRKVSPRLLATALVGALGEIASHRKFSDCDAHRFRKWAHLGLLYGFLGLFLLAGVAAVFLFLGIPYPFPPLHPLKVLGNGFAVLLLGGCAWFVVERVSLHLRDRKSGFFDWAFLAVMGTVGLTGVAVEVLRLVDARSLAYPTYFVHLVLVFLLLVFLPFSKFAHAAYRTLALASGRYDALRAAREDRGFGVTG